MLTAWCYWAIAQQLEQPLKGSHPEGADLSALEHLLAGAKTIPYDKGLFLEKTWRLHPKLTQFTSEVFYEDRLRSRDGLDSNALKGMVGLDNRASGMFQSSMKATRMPRRKRLRLSLAW